MSHSVYNIRQLILDLLTEVIVYRVVCSATSWFQAKWTRSEVMKGRIVRHLGCGCE